MTQQEFERLLRRYSQGKCSDEEEQYVAKWFESLQQKNIKDLDSAERMFLQRALWKKVERNTVRKLALNHRFAYRRLAKVAASVVVLLACSLLIVEYNDEISSFDTANNSSVKMIRVSNTGSVTRCVELMDGSILSLEPGSEITYPEVFNAVREVFLQGEVFFEVSKDAARPFLVYTNDITTKVLGTSFRIKAYEDQEEISVAVKTGRVAVLNKGKERTKKPMEVILTPNQEMVYHKKNAQVSRKLVDEPKVVDTETSLKMHYVNSPALEVFEALEKAYNIDISFDKELMSGCTITTDLIDEGLYERLDLICYALGATYQVDETSIIIKINGCR